MEDKSGSRYFLVKKKAVPEVLLKVVEAKRLLESERAITVQEATEKVGSAVVPFISIRTTFSLSMITPRERLLPLWFRWTTNRDF